MRYTKVPPNGRARVAAVVALVSALALGLTLWSGDANASGTAAGAIAAPGGLDAGTSKDEDAGRLYADLERHLRWQPTDARAWVFKARLDMRARRYEQAAAGFAKALAGKSKVGNDPGVWVEYAEARGMAQGRTLVGEPLKLVHKALAIDPRHGAALDLAGSAAWEMKDFAQAAAHWTRLLEQIPPGTSRHMELAQAVERARQRSRISLPPKPGP